MERRASLNKSITFIIITTLISVLIFVWMFSGARNDTGVVFLMMWTPAISAIITSVIYKEKIKSFGWKPRNFRIMVLAWLLPVIAGLTAYGIAWLSGYAEFTAAQAVNYRWAEMLGFDLPAPLAAALLSKLFLASIMALIFAAGEEIGWSGYLIPRLAGAVSVPLTGIVTGLFWAVWHFPAIIGGFYGSGAPLWTALPGFTLVLTSLGFMKTILVLNSKTLWTGTMMHIGHNVVVMGILYELTVKKDFVNYILSETGIFLGIIYAVAAFILWKFQKRHPEITVGF